MSKVAPCLWFDREAEEAAAFYVSLLPDSRIEEVARYAADTPGGKEGEVMTVEFTLAGRRFIALNGGPHFQFTPAVSMSIDCADQAEVDRLWSAFLQNGGKPQQCGWIADRYGLSWQVVPRRLIELVNDPDRARAKRVMQAMLTMVKLDVAALERAYDG
jgi:predicted 3-demethylubiquinone-9 3-methyltransferase (glyoxalase superfamily)